jgi:sugar phosphate isomerase/epimerase
VQREGLVRACDYADWETRSWTYRAVGEGHDPLFWRQFISELRRAGYDDVVTIEIEEPYLSLADAITTSVATLQPMIPKDPVPSGNWFENYDWDEADKTSS